MVCELFKKFLYYFILMLKERSLLLVEEKGLIMRIMHVV